ncbi:hypothetical protein MMC13_001671 [Lambiella insularis]|nr:hypothetical protein [Lambiella insularis]
MRIRDLGYSPGELPPGPKNSILDVEGVRVGQRTVHSTHNGIPSHKGATIILPRPAAHIQHPCYAGYHVLNGNGELTGAFQITEWGYTNTPLALTNSLSLGTAFSATWAWLLRRARAAGQDDDAISRHYGTPVVAETADWLLNELEESVLAPQDISDAFDAAETQPEVLEGPHGGGAGMSCHGFAAGVGTSSRVVEAQGREAGWTVGVLVQTNYGVLRDLRIGGVPVGRLLEAEGNKAQEEVRGRMGEGSVVVVIITDAPMLPSQLQRLATRATLGLVQVGGNSAARTHSGDIFLALSTGNHPNELVDDGLRTPIGAQTYSVEAVKNESMNEFFRATSEATEEAILNSLVGARDGLTGKIRLEGLPVERVRELLSKHLVVV